MSLKMDESQCPRCYKDTTGHWPAVPSNWGDEMREACCDRECLEQFDDFLHYIEGMNAKLYTPAKLPSEDYGLQCERWQDRKHGNG